MICFICPVIFFRMMVPVCSGTTSMPVEQPTGGGWFVGFVFETFEHLKAEYDSRYQNICILKTPTASPGISQFSQCRISGFTHVVQYGISKGVASSGFLTAIRLIAVPGSIFLHAGAFFLHLGVSFILLNSILFDPESADD